MAMTSAPEAQAIPATTTRSRDARVQQILLCALVAVFVWVGWIARPVLGLDQGDDLTYIALSHSIDSGSYRETFRPSAPAHVKYPPGYPAWLVAVRHLTGERLELIPAFNLALAAAALVMIFRFARRVEGGWFALLVLVPLVINHGMLFVGGSYFSEALFVFLTTGAIGAAIRADDNDRRWAYVAIACALLAFLTRSAGVAMVLAIGVWLVIGKRRPAELIAYVTSTALVVGGWFAYTSLGRNESPVRGYIYDFNPEGVVAHPSVLARQVFRILNSAWRYFTELLPYELAFPSIPGTPIDNVVWFVLLAVCLVIGMRFLWRYSPAAAVYLVIYGAMLVSFPYIASRLIEPITPLLMLMFLLGAWKATGVLNKPVRLTVLVGLGIVLIVGALIRVNEVVGTVSQCNRKDSLHDRHCYADRTLRFVEATEYIAAHTAPNEYALGWRAPGIHFLSGRLAESALIVQEIPKGELAPALRERNIKFVLLSPGSGIELVQLSNALMRSCKDFRLERHFAAATLLLSPTPPSGPADDACVALTEFRNRYKPVR